MSLRKQGSASSLALAISLGGLGLVGTACAGSTTSNNPPHAAAKGGDKKCGADSKGDEKKCGADKGADSSCGEGSCG